MTNANSVATSKHLWQTWRWRVVLLTLIAGTGYFLWPGTNGEAPNQQHANAELLLSPVDIATVTRETSGRDVSFTGTLKPWQQATLNAHFSGEVLHINVKAGDVVAAGDVLIELDTRLINAQHQQALSALKTAQLEAAQAHQKQQQIKKLNSKGYTSTIEYDTASRQWEMALAQVASAKAALEQIQTQKDDAIIRAPFGGSIAQRFADPGEVVAAGAPLLKLVDMHRLELEALVASADISQVSLQQRASFSVNSNRQQMHQGVVVRINPEARQDNRRVPVYIEVDNSLAKLPAGIFVRGSIIDSNPVSGLALPSTALQPTETGWRVFVVNNQRIESRNVNRLLDDLANEKSLVSGAIRNHDQVVVLPGASLSDLQPVRLMNEG